MKAAVIYHADELPEYADMPDPIPQQEDELLVTVKAVALKHFDKGQATGKHYSANTPKQNGRVIGGDGVCLLEDGTRVYGIGVSGMLAEKATIDKHRMVKIPAGIDNATAAALPNAIIGSAMGLRFKADIKLGDVVLINGATGFTGQIAVQVAKIYGAGKIIVTGRNAAALNKLLTLGADEAITLLQDDEAFKTQIKALHASKPVDIIIDYLWGHSAEMILACLKGNGSFTNHIRYVSVGSVAGDLIHLSAANLRSVNIQLSGSGLGAWSKQQVGMLFNEILPHMFQLAAEGKLRVQTVSYPLQNISEVWNLDIASGSRLVVTV